MCKERKLSTGYCVAYVAGYYLVILIYICFLIGLATIIGSALGAFLRVVF